MVLEPLLGLLGVGLGAGVNARNNERNIQMQRETNQMNMQIAREANAAQAAESEKAFQRSKATTQVNLMRAAGMSKAGALNALSGGGVYTPAPVNTAQMQAPSSNVDGVVNALSSLGKGFGNTAQLKQAKEMAQKELDMQKYQFEEQLKLERDKFDEDKINNSSMRSLNDSQIAKIAKELELTDAQVKKLAADTDLTKQQLLTEIERTGLTAAQILQVQEDTKLSTQKILESISSIQDAAKKLELEQKHYDLSKIGAEDAHQIALLQKEQLSDVVSKLKDPQAQAVWRQRLNNEEISLQVENLRTSLEQLKQQKEYAWYFDKYGYVVKDWYQYSPVDCLFAMLDSVQMIIEKIPIAGDLLQLIGRIFK